MMHIWFLKQTEKKDFLREPSKIKSFPPPMLCALFIVWREMATWNAFIDLNAQKWLPLWHLLWYIRFEFHSWSFNILLLIFGHLRLVSKQITFLLKNEMIKMCGLWALLSPQDSRRFLRGATYLQTLDTNCSLSDTHWLPVCHFIQNWLERWSQNCKAFTFQQREKRLCTWFFNELQWKVLFRDVFSVGLYLY